MKFIIAFAAIFASTFAQECETIGNYRCADEGNAPEFFICGIGNIDVPMFCGEGTVCRQLGTGVYCGYPSDASASSPASTASSDSASSPASTDSSSSTSEESSTSVSSTDSSSSTSEESSTSLSSTDSGNTSNISENTVTVTEKTTDLTTITETVSASSNSTSTNTNLDEILSIISSELGGVDNRTGQCSLEDDGKYFCPGASGEGNIILWCLGQRLIPIDCAEGQVCTVGENNSTFCGSVEKVTINSLIAVTTTNVVTTTVLSSSLVISSSSI
ncbi:hypothetical protein BB561_001831 [Smittium simulii]|uniref:Carbohydrate-binding module family 19 domain-containing protein n=1 Tax=Smittium simulii TaxID=133385 RepID=A0A2T9YSS8_9FUNG|nr:hypothetical protein BB561_001831 [Smittium simulii]